MYDIVEILQAMNVALEGRLLACIEKPGATEDANLQIKKCKLMLEAGSIRRLIQRARYLYRRSKCSRSVEIQEMKDCMQEADKHDKPEVLDPILAVSRVLDANEDEIDMSDDLMNVDFDAYLFRMEQEMPDDNDYVKDKLVTYDDSLPTHLSACTTAVEDSPAGVDVISIDDGSESDTDMCLALIASMESKPFAAEPEGALVAEPSDALVAEPSEPIASRKQETQELPEDSQEPLTDTDLVHLLGDIEGVGDLEPGASETNGKKRSREAMAEYSVVAGLAGPPPVVTPAMQDELKNDRKEKAKKLTHLDSFPIPDEARVVPSNFHAKTHAAFMRLPKECLPDGVCTGLLNKNVID